MFILILSFVFLLLISFLFYFVYKKRKLAYTQLNNINTIHSKKYINNYFVKFVISIIIICLFGTTLFLSENPFSDNEINSLDNNDDTNELLFLLDLSNSMNAEDANNDTDNNINKNNRNKLSRLEAAKQIVNIVCDNIDNCNFGLTGFAGNAETIVPISEDKKYLQQFLSVIETNYLSNQGTNIEAGLNEAISCFSNNKKISKLIILLTDAENHYGNIGNALKLLKSNNINIITIGLGSENGAMIPIGDNVYLKEINGNNVITTFNTEILTEISTNNFIFPFDTNLLITNINKNITQISTHNNLNQNKQIILNILIFSILLLVTIKHIL
jgi:Ca-activated chloride channel family protein